MATKLKTKLRTRPKPLTDATIKSAKPLSAKKFTDVRIELPDGLVDGLYLRVGSRDKTWELRYRNKAGKRRRMAIGRYVPPEGERVDPTTFSNQQLEELTQRGRLGLAEAREVARMYARQVALDKDPRGEAIEVQEAKSDT